jgi:hypothetical protein
MALPLKEFIMSDVQSIKAVNTTRGWAVCQSNSDGTELFVMPDVFEPRFSQDHAEHAAELLRHHLETGGKTYAKPLPTGVNLVS